MTSAPPPRLKRAIVRAAALVALAGIVLTWPSVAAAQLARIGGSVPALQPGPLMRGTDTSYDPTRDMYLIVVGNGPIYAVFVNPSGVPLTGPIVVMDGSAGFGHFPRAESSPDVANGTGGFLVTWHHNVGSVNCVFGRVVSLAVPGGLASPIQQLSDGAEGGSWWETGPAMAYSRSSRRFLVAWRTIAYGVSGRFVDANGSPMGGILPLAPPAPAAGTRDPALVWNPYMDEFGMVTTGWSSSAALANFRRIRASDGYVLGRTDFGFSRGTFSTGIDLNTANNTYVAAWGLHPGTMTATLDAYGTLLSSTLVTSRLGFDQSLAFAFNAGSGSFLAVSSDINSLEIGAVEVAGSGAPNTVAQIVTDGALRGSFYPMTTARGNMGNQWEVVYSRDFVSATSQILTSASFVAPPPPPPPPPPSTGCTRPDPFASIGGGRCVNGGWLPGGGGSGGCTTPDPFVSLGGGSCVNGGWQPGGGGSGGSGCATPDPFASLGGGRCVNGGWQPGGGGVVPPPPPAPAPPPPPTGCATPDPFASIGGGACVNGGWTPRTSSCTTPDPFASIGGGTCVNGGWTPGSSAPIAGGGCTTADPFASIGGGTCSNGGWVPRNSSCTTPDPFASLGGGVCASGGWRPR